MTTHYCFAIKLLENSVLALWDQTVVNSSVSFGVYRPNCLQIILRGLNQVSYYYICADNPDLALVCKFFSKAAGRLEILIAINVAIKNFNLS